MFKEKRIIDKLYSRAEVQKTPRYDEEGFALVELCVMNDDHFISPISTKTEPIITAETAEFLEHSVKHIKSSKPLHFKIESDVIDPEEEVVYKKAIKNYYSQELAETKEKLKRNTIISLSMALVGILVFLLTIFLGRLGTFELLFDCLEVVAWVFMWEAVDVFFFRRLEIKAQQVRFIKIWTAKTTFIKQEHKN